MAAIRVLLTKFGVDHHDRGVRYVAAKLRDAGMEVVYAPFLLPQDAVRVAVQEDVDVLGLSSSSGGHMVAVEAIAEGLHREGRSDVILIVGGIIPERDRPRLRELGVDGVFGPGASAAAIVEFVNRNVRDAACEKPGGVAGRTEQ